MLVDLSLSICSRLGSDCSNPLLVSVIATVHSCCESPVEYIYDTKVCPGISHRQRISPPELILTHQFSDGNSQASEARQHISKHNKIR